MLYYGESFAEEKNFIKKKKKKKKTSTVESLCFENMMLNLLET